jgi:Uncharacterised nucleotidyltransferase
MKGNCPSKLDNLIIALITPGTEFYFGNIKDIDWNHLFQTAQANRLDGIIYDSLDRNGIFDTLLEKVRKKFEDSYRRTVINTRIYLETADGIQRAFSNRGIDLIVLRGPALGLTLYSRPYLRPSGDLDLLIRRKDIPLARKILDELDFTIISGVLPDRYFEKHHLHLSFRNHGSNSIVELHWALDHSYTLYTMDYDSLLSEKEEASFEGLTIPVLSPEDRLITLCLHLVKHCPFLHCLIEEDDLITLLLKGRWMLWLLDIHLLLTKSGESFDWETIQEKARRWGIDYQIAVCLAAASRVFHAPLSAQYQSHNIKTRINPLETQLYRIQLSRLRGEEKGRRTGRFLFGLRTDTIFRPIRAIDLTRYLFPPPEYLRRKYRIGSLSLLFAYPRHAISGAIRLTRNLVDLIYYRAIK